MTDKTFKDYLKEDSVDEEKHDALNNIAMSLSALETEIQELQELDGDIDSTGVGDLTDQLTTMRKLVNSFEDVIDRSTRIVPMESVEEAVGDSAKPIYDLIDDLGDDDKAHANVLHDLIRYLDGDQIKDFVDEFRRVNDYGDGLEYESVKKEESQNLDYLKKLAGI